MLITKYYSLPFREPLGCSGKIENGTPHQNSKNCRTPRSRRTFANVYYGSVDPLRENGENDESVEKGEKGEKGGKDGKGGKGGKIYRNRNFNVTKRTFVISFITLYSLFDFTADREDSYGDSSRNQ